MEAEFKRITRRALTDFPAPKAQRLDTQTLLYPFDPALAWVAVHYLRTPSRVFWDLVAFKTKRLEPLYDQVRAWMAACRGTWLKDGLTFSVEPRNVSAFEAGPQQIRGTVKNGLIEGAAARGFALTLDPEDPDLLFSVRSVDESLVLSIDLGGQSLHARGYRTEGGSAPLRETLAAQMLILARWDPRHDPLLDPMAGSGTIAIEARAMAVGAPLWVGSRRPRLERNPALKNACPPKIDNLSTELFPGTEPVIMASDMDPRATRAMERNMARAGFRDSIATRTTDFRLLSPSDVPDGGLLISNPPYGERLQEPGGEEELLALYQALGSWFRTLGPAWRACFLVAHPDFEAAFGEQPVIKKPMHNGPLSGIFLTYGQAPSRPTQPPSDSPQGTRHREN